MELKNNKVYENICFSDLGFSKTIVKLCTFERCEFKNCDFSESEFRDCKFTECVFKDSNLSLIKLIKARFVDTRFELCKIIGVDWTLLDWAGVTLSAQIGFDSCDISYSAFNSLELPELVVKKCKVHNVGFELCNLTGAQFCESDLANTRLNSSKLNECDFRGADNFVIDPTENSIVGAIFSFPEVLNLLSPFGVKIDQI